MFLRNGIVCISFDRDIVWDNFWEDWCNMPCGFHVDGVTLWYSFKCCSGLTVIRTAMSCWDILLQLLNLWLGLFIWDSSLRFIKVLRIFISSDSFKLLLWRLSWIISLSLLISIVHWVWFSSSFLGKQILKVTQISFEELVFRP